MSSAHTPGPWHVYPQPVADRAAAKAELSALVDGTSGFVPTLYMIGTPNGLAPAVTGCAATSEANARLIAAAPELYEIVRDAELWFSDSVRIAARCRAALAKVAS